MTIRVGKKWDKDAQYIGRGSPLGNPFFMADESQRDKVCDQYQVWFEAKIAAKDPAVMQELERLHSLAQQGDLILGCYCAPKRCHGETIKAYLDCFFNWR